MRSHRNAHPSQRGLAVAGRAIGDASGHEVFLGDIVGEHRRRLVRLSMQTINRNALALLHFPIQIAPVRREIGSIIQPRRHFEVAHLQHVAGHRAFDEDRAGHDVHAGRAVMLGDRRIQLPNGGVHHQIGRIAGMVRDGLGADQIAARDAQRGRERGIEIAPMNIARTRRKVVQRCHSAAVRSCSPSRFRHVVRYRSTSHLLNSRWVCSCQEYRPRIANRDRNPRCTSVST